MLNQFDIRPIRSLGQNFLVDDRVVDQILKAADVLPGDLILEIGPGIGGLTRALAGQAGCVLALEIDRRVIPALRHVTESFNQVQIIEGDALKMSFSDLTRNHPGPVKVVANLPYYITTPLMIKALTDIPGLDRMVVMIQREAAERVLAKPGSRQYGPLAVLCSSFGTLSRAFIVKSGSFIPRPNVDSCVIRLVRDTRIAPGQWQPFAEFVEACFSQRRRTLVNSLKISGFSPERLSRIPDIIRSAGLALDVRPERIAAEQFYQMFLDLTATD